MLPCSNNLHQEDVESQSKINFKFREKQPKIEVHFKILIHYFACYLRACYFFSKCIRGWDSLSDSY